MRAARLATVAAFLLLTFSYTTPVKAQVLFTTGTGACHLCGHAELDTQRYINSFLNQLFFPNSAIRRGSVAASLYLLTATFTIHGSLSPDPAHSSVTISITAEVKNAIPTGGYHVTAVTPAGKVFKDTYPIGTQRFNVRGAYARGAKRKSSGSNSGGGGPGPGGRGGFAPPGWTNWWRGSSRPAGCTRSRMEARGNETIVYCSRG